MLAELAKFAAGVRRAGKRNTSARKALPLFQHLALHLMQIIVSHFTHLHLNNFPKVIPSRLCRLSLSLPLLQHAERETKTFAGNFYCYDGAYTDKRGKQCVLQKLRELPVCSGFPSPGRFYSETRRTFKDEAILTD